jgi:ATP-dependent Clp protease protease subunit
LSSDDPESDICLFVNSPGGSVLAGLAVYDVMQLIPNDVVTVATGRAASTGQVLLCAGAAGKRSHCRTPRY